MTATARARWEALLSVAEGESFQSADLSSVSSPSFMFRRCDFTDADLRLATLRSTFICCSFKGANLRGADLRGAKFSGCDLSGADLRDADLTHAAFNYANTGADNGRTNLTDVLLEGADLDGAIFDQVIGYEPPA